MLTEHQKRKFVREGFLRVINVVPKNIIRRAKRAINSSIGQGIDPTKIAIFDGSSFCPELREDPRIIQLATNPPTWGKVAALLGRGRAVKPTSAQIALRFPVQERLKPKKGSWHIDGYPTPTNGVEPDGQVRNFNLLLGVLISEVPASGYGNLAVWPGTHKCLGDYFKENSAFPPPYEKTSKELGFANPPRKELRGNIGDIFLVHYNLGHAVMPNLSEDIRYMCFFRIAVKGLLNHREESLSNIWMDYHGISGK